MSFQATAVTHMEIEALPFEGIIQDTLLHTNDQVSRTIMTLMASLQTSLLPEEILARFSFHIQSLIPHSGLRFHFEDADQDYVVGRFEKYHCQVAFRLDDMEMGQLIISREKPDFTERECRLLRSLLSCLIHPLNNANDFQTAKRQALLDPLTGLGNRSAMDEAIRREIASARRHRHSLSLMTADIDFFKQINDEYGHSCGDMTLKKVARYIADTMRNNDMVFRYGGEEFVLLLSQTRHRGAQRMAERLRAGIESMSLQYGDSMFQITISIGIATLSKQDTAMTLFDKADQALYRAKQSGRNQCCLYKDRGIFQLLPRLEQSVKKQQPSQRGRLLQKDLACSTIKA